MYTIYTQNVLLKNITAPSCNIIVEASYMNIHECLQI